MYLYLRKGENKDPFFSLEHLLETTVQHKSCL